MGLLALSIIVTGAMVVPLGSIRFKTLSGTAIVICVYLLPPSTRLVCSVTRYHKKNLERAEDTSWIKHTLSMVVGLADAKTCWQISFNPKIYTFFFLNNLFIAIPTPVIIVFYIIMTTSSWLYWLDADWGRY